MKRKRWLVLAAVILAAICLFGGLRRLTPYTCYDGLTHRLFSIDTDDVEISLQDGGDGTYDVPEDPAATRELLNDFRYVLWLPSARLFISSGGWEERIVIDQDGTRQAYLLFDNGIEVNDLIFYGNTTAIRDSFRLQAE